MYKELNVGYGHWTVVGIVYSKLNSLNVYNGTMDLKRILIVAVCGDGWGGGERQGTFLQIKTIVRKKR